MSRQKILALLERIVQRTLQDDALRLCEETSLDQSESWDSLVQLEVMVAAEGEFGILFDVQEMTEAREVSHLIDLIEAKVTCRGEPQG